MKHLPGMTVMRRSYILALGLILLVLTAQVAVTNTLVWRRLDYANSMVLSAGQSILALAIAENSALHHNSTDPREKAHLHESIIKDSEELMARHFALIRGDEKHGILLSADAKNLKSYFYEEPHRIDSRVRAFAEEALRSVNMSLAAEEREKAFRHLYGQSRRGRGHTLMTAIDSVIARQAAMSREDGYMILVSGCASLLIMLALVLATARAVFEPLLRQIAEKTQDLHQQQIQLSHFIENIPLPVAVLDRESRFILHSKMLSREFLGRDENLAGRKFRATFPFLPAEWDNILRKVIAGGHLAKDEDQVPNIHGGRDHVRWKAIPWQEKDGGISGSILFMENITERKKLEDEQDMYKTRLEELVERRTGELRAETRRAENALQIKGDFLANMSHELRTPLNSIIGLARLMQNTILDAEQAEMLDTIRQASTAQLAIVNNILDLSAIENGNIELENIGFDLGEKIRGLVRMLEPLAAQKGLGLEVDFPGGALPLAHGDPVKIGQVMQNLVANAVKYTDSGRIALQADHLKTGPDSMEFHFSVTDTGIGIAPDKLESIFEKFTQGDNSTRRKYGGTGLGLAICRQLVGLLGGAIEVDSVPGQGSRFRFSIPLGIAKELHKDENKIHAPAHASTQPLVPVARARILVAEDYDLNQVFIRKLMEAIGGPHYKIVETGAQVLQALGEGHYDLILMDCHMPKMNGYEAARRIRESEAVTGKRIGIIALTADAMNDNEEKCREAGMDAFISKPVNIDQLCAALGRWIDCAALPAKPMPAHPPLPKAPAQTPLDLTGLYQNMNDNEEDVRHFVQLFIDHGRGLLKTLDSERGSPDNAKWHDAAHRLMGTAGYVGAIQLVPLCEQAEKMKQDERPARDRIVADIEAAFTKVETYFRKEGYIH